MLRVDNNAKLVRLGWSFPRVFSGRFAIESGRRLFATRWKQVEIDRVLATQKDQPVALFGINNKMLWYFHDRFYWDDDGLTGDDVKALVLQRERRLQRSSSLLAASCTPKPPGDRRERRSLRTCAERCSSATAADVCSVDRASSSSTTTSCRWRWVAPRRSRTCNFSAPRATGARAIPPELNRVREQGGSRHGRTGGDESLTVATP
jgi:hypothetical protein